MERMLTQQEREGLLKIARQSILTHTGSRNIPKIVTENPKLSEKRGVFVSLHTLQGELRGCIGLIEGRVPLLNAVQEMAIAAATQDSRFPAVHPEELKRLLIEISVLSPLKRVNNISEIIVEKHGLLIKQGHYSGLLLPQVATEYGWSREEFLRQASVKACLPTDAWQKGAEIYLFTAEVFSERAGG